MKSLTLLSDAKRGIKFAAGVAKLYVREKRNVNTILLVLKCHAVPRSSQTRNLRHPGLRSFLTLLGVISAALMRRRAATSTTVKTIRGGPSVLSVPTSPTNFFRPRIRWAKRSGSTGGLTK